MKAPARETVPSRSRTVQLESKKHSGGQSARFEDNRNSATAQPVVQAKNASSTLPENLKAGVESLSGQSMEGVNVHHNSSAPAQLQAHAFAQGSDIHLGPGQEKHLPHEAWHVAQQRQGRVQPTVQMKGVSVNHDTSLEREADVMGARAQSVGQSVSSDAVPEQGKPSGVSAKVLQGGFFDSVKAFFGGKKKEEPKPEAAAKSAPESPKDTPVAEPEAEAEKPAIDDRATSWKEVDAAADKSRMDAAGQQFLEDKHQKKKDAWMVKKDTGTLWDSDDYTKKGPDGKRVAMTAEERLEKVQKDKQDNIASAGKGMIYGDAKNPVDNLKGKMTDVVKTVQADEATLLKRDVQINGDAAVNAYFGDEKRLNTDPEGLAAQGRETLMPKYQAIVMSPDKTRMKNGEIKTRKIESLANARESKKAVQETANDRSIVQMYWNELEKKGAEYGKAKDASQKQNLRKEAEKIYGFAFDRQFWVKERVTDADFQKEELESEGRIADMFYALSGNSVGTAMFNAVVGKLTAGFLSVRGHKDKRGFGTDKDFDIDLESGEAEQKDLLSEDAKKSGLNKKMGGGREWITPMTKLREAKAEFLAKTGNRAGKGLAYRFTWLGQVIEVVKKFLGIAKSIISGLALWFAGIAIGFPPFAVPATMMSGISYYLTLVNTGLSTLKLLFDSLAQMTNNNPALFLELSGETAQSGFNVATESMAFAGTKIGLNAAKAATSDSDFEFKDLYDQTDKFDADGIMDAEHAKEAAKAANGAESSPGMLSSEYWEKYGQGGYWKGVGENQGVDAGWVAANAATTAGAGVVNKVLSKEANAGTGSNLRTYDMSQDKDRRIKAEGPKAVAGAPAKSSAPTSGEESALILQAYETTLLKAKKESTKFSGWLGPLATAKPAAIPASEELSKDEQASAQRSGGAVSDVREGAARFRVSLETIPEVDETEEA